MELEPGDVIIDKKVHEEHMYLLSIAAVGGSTADNKQYCFVNKAYRIEVLHHKVNLVHVTDLEEWIVTSQVLLRRGTTLKTVKQDLGMDMYNHAKSFFIERDNKLPYEGEAIKDFDEFDQHEGSDLSY